MRGFLAVLGLAACAALFSVSASSGAATATFSYPSGACPAGATGLTDCITAASDGDTINVKPGTYYENVNVTRPITIKGKTNKCDKVLFDGTVPGPPAAGTRGVAFLVQADNVTIACLTIRNATDGVRNDGGDYDNLSVSKITTRGVDRGVAATGASADDHSVTDSTFRGLDQSGVNIEGDGATVAANKCLQGGSDCIRVNGDDARVMNNRATNIDDGNMAEVSGENPWVNGNVGISIESEGLDVDCAATCDDVRVQNNTVWGVPDDSSGIDVNVSPVAPCAVFPCIRVTGNTVDLAVENGFDLFFDDGLISGNSATRSGESDGGQGTGFDLNGDRNRFENNSSTKNTIDGLRLDGDDNVILKNLFSENYLDGLHLQSGTGNTLHKNTVVWNDGDGIENDGTNTTITNNVSMNNRADCVGGGTILFASGNTCADGSNFGFDGTVD